MIEEHPHVQPRHLPHLQEGHVEWVWSTQGHGARRHPEVGALQMHRSGQGRLPGESERLSCATVRALIPTTYAPVRPVREAHRHSCVAQSIHPSTPPRVVDTH